MRLVEQHIIKSNNKYYKDLKELCRKSKNLYNTTLYCIRQHFFETKSYLPYVQVDKIFKDTNNIDYRSLPSQPFSSFVELFEMVKTYNRYY